MELGVDQIRTVQRAQPGGYTSFVDVGELRSQHVAHLRVAEYFSGGPAIKMTRNKDKFLTFGTLRILTR